VVRHFADQFGADVTERRGDEAWAFLEDIVDRSNVDR
jgi:hypothetical protein